MKINFNNWLRSFAICLMDCAFLNVALCMSCIFISYLFRGDYSILTIYINAIPYLSFCCLIIFSVMGIHKSLWGHVTLSDLLNIAIAIFLSTFTAYVIVRVQQGAWQNPIIPVATFYIFLTLSAGIRILPSLAHMIKSSTINKSINSLIPLLIIGAGEATDALIKDITMSSPPSLYRIVGILDDDPRKEGHKLRGVNILGNTQIISDIVRKHRIQEIIIAIPSATTGERQKLIAATISTGCKVRMMSRISELSAPTVADLHDMDITDLLGRSEVSLNPDQMSTYITNNVILVTGGGGSIGSELCRQIMLFDPKTLIIFDQYENNAYDLIQELGILYRDKTHALNIRIGSVQDIHRLKEVFDEFSPDIVFHAAAYKHVPLMEECPNLAVENNVFGTYNVAMAAIAAKTRRFVMISTDKAVNPTNVMGASKRIAEIIIHSLNSSNTEFVAVRFGNVLGSNGSVVPVFRRQIESGGPITITHPDIIRYFMTIPEAARLVLQASAMARGGETFILDMGEPVKILDLATTMIEMAGLLPDKDIKIVFTGLRPGEKLYEEILLNEEGIQKTTENKIFVAKSETISAQKRDEIISSLRDSISNNKDIKACIHNIIPNYLPNGQA